MSHTFCPLPWKHLSTQANGDLRVCCQCVSPPYGKATKSDGSFYNAKKDDDSEVRNSTIFKEIRAQMLKGEKPRHCELCWKEEALGKSSRRLDELKLLPKEFETQARELTSTDGTLDIEKFPLRHLDLRLGNHCNLKCRSCSPRDSDSWYDDYAKMTLSHSFFRRTPPKLDGRYPFKKSEKGWILDTKDFSWHEDSALLQAVEKNLDHLERIYFTGGEPTLIHAHWKLLEKLIEKGRAPHIRLDYNTNVSGVTPEWLAIWGKFKHAFLGCSVDGIREKAIYLRPPVEWHTIERNLQRIAEGPQNISAGLCVTLSAYNVFHYVEILEYLWNKNWKNFYFLPFGQVLEHPSWMSIQVLPPETKKHVRERYDDFFRKNKGRFELPHQELLRQKLDYILSYMDQADRPGELRTFFRRTEELDKLRGQSFKETFPELVQELRK